MNPTDNGTNYYPNNKMTNQPRNKNMSPATGNNISSDDILVFPHMEALYYLPTQNQYNTVDTKPFLNFTFTNKLKSCSQPTNTLTKDDVTHRHTIPSSTRKGRL